MTNAWLQRILVLGSLIFWWAAAAWLWSGQRSSAWACLAAPLLITPLILGLQCAWAAAVNRADVAIKPASFAQWLRAWGSECLAAAKVFTWWQPFRHHAMADELKPTPGKRGMVLVHGFFCNRALWTDWMARLQAEQRAFVSVDLEPAFGSISDYADIIEAAISQVHLATGLPPVIVCHSMGGLAIRAWAAKFGKHRDTNGDGMNRIARIITLGTPHHGTAIATASYSENGRQMRLASAWQADNASQLPHNFAQFFTCYFSHCDNIVFPASTATLPGADNRHIAGHAHMQLVFSKDIQQACFGLLET